MGIYYQVQTAVACAFSSLLMGLLNVWPSYTLDLYTSPNTTILNEPMNEFESSLLGSLPSLGAMVGTGVAGLIMDGIGRKRAGVVLTLPYVLSWTLIDLSSSSTLILVGRFLGGVSGGTSLVFGPIFISEVAQDSIRGTLASLPVTFYCFGALCSYMLGWYSSYQTIIWLNLATSVFGAVLCALVAESPVYLLRNNMEEEARKSIAHYRGVSPASKIVLEELSRLKAQIIPAVELTSVAVSDAETKEESEKLNAKDSEVQQEGPVKISAWKMLYVSGPSRRAFIVVGSTLTLQVFMGMVPVQVYAKVLFAQAAPDLSSHFCSVLFAIVLLTGSMLTGAIADKAGRRLLIISSAAAVAVCMCLLGVVLQTGCAPAWVTTLVLLLYCFSFNFGSGTIPYVLLAEVFVSEVQGFASMLLIEWVWFLNFIIIAIFPYMTKLLGIHGVFYIFAAVAIADSAVSFLIVPETKGLSNQQIQDALRKK